jgi:glycosyltransferase involved in cell wall biosynthesis
VAVAPKLSPTEANGKILNYMAAGLPVVASDTPVNRELLGEWGVYAPPGNTEELARGLVSLLDDEARARALGKALRERAEAHFAWSTLGRRIVNLYDRLASGRG